MQCKVHIQSNQGMGLKVTLHHFLLATSIPPLQHPSFCCPSDIRQESISSTFLKPLFWFIVVSSVFYLFSFLDRFFTNFSHSYHVSSSLKCSDPLPGYLPLSLLFGGATHHGFHPKYPLKFHKNGHWMTCCPL